MIASLPGGLDGLAALVDELHANGVKALWPVSALSTISSLLEH